MKIKFLGTAAAEAFPAMFCDCENCRTARRLGGRNIRSRTQSLVDNSLLIDFPADTYYHFEKYEISSLDIENCLITHIHSDHFYTPEFECSLNGCSHPPKDWHGITVWGSVDLKKPFEKILETNSGFFAYNEIKPFVPVAVGAYTVTPLKANHGTENPFIYIIQRDSKALLYAHDTGTLPEESEKYIADSGIKFDLVSVDCTEGALDAVPYEGHMCLGMNIRFRDLLLSLKAADNSTVFVLNHFSHNGENAVYDNFKTIAEKQGFTVAYDGLEIEF